MGKLPSNVRIGGVNYAIVEVEKLQDEDGTRRYYGKIDHLRLGIEIEQDMAHEVKVQATLHEILHGLFHQTGHYDIEEEERVVQMLGCQLPRLLRSNPALCDLILGHPLRVSSSPEDFPDDSE